MNRQLYMGGGIMNVRPRQQYGLGSFVKKAVKKVTGGVKDIVSSDLGKAALAGAAVYGLGGGTFGGLRASAPGFSFANLPGASFFGSGSFNPLKTLVSSEGFSGLGPSKFAQFLGTGKGKLAAGGVLASLFAGMSVADQADIDEADIDERGDIVAEKLRQSLTRLGYSGKILEDKVAEGVSEYTGYTSKAEGGRIGFDMGSPREGIGSLLETEDLLNEGNSGNEFFSMADAIGRQPNRGPGIVIEDEYNPKDFMIEKFQEESIAPKILGEGFQGGEKIFVIETPRGGTMMITEEDYITKFGKTNRAEGGRIGYANGEMVMEEQVTEVSETMPKETAPTGDGLSYEELRGRLPKEITDDIVVILAESPQALVDFAEIQTQTDVDEFNMKYGVNLSLPSGA